MTAGPSPPTPVFPIGRPLRWLVALSSRRPALTVTAWLAVAVVMLAWAFVALRFETSMLRLLSPTARYVTLYEQYSRNFGELDDVMIIVESGDVRRSVAFADRLVGALRRGPVRFHRLTYRVDPGHVAGQRLLYLTLDELTSLQRTLIDHRDFIERFAARPGLTTLLAGIRQRIDAGILLSLFDLGLDDRTSRQGLAVLGDLVGQLQAVADGHDGDHSPWAGFWGLGRDRDEGLFLSDDKRLLFVFADPLSGGGGFAADREAIEEIRRRIAELRVEFPDVSAGVTGGPALSADEMTSAFRDSGIATLVAAVLTLAVLVLAFRQVVKPLVMLGVLATSVIVSIGVITLTVGHLTIFSVMFISMVVGLGIDYGIYVLYRYEAERAGRDPRDAVAVVAERSGPGIVLGALSGAVTFYVLMLTDFRGIREFGFVAGTALLIALLAMLTLFPAALVLVDASRLGRYRDRRPGPDGESRLLRFAAERRGVVLTLAGVAAVLAAATAQGVGFDYNLMNLQAPGTESVRWEKRIIESGTRSVFGALDTAGSIAELRAKAAAFRRLPSVADVDSVTMLIPDDQPAKIGLLSGVRPLVSGLRVEPRRRLDGAEMVREVETLGRRLAFVAEQAPADAGAEVRGLEAGVDRLRTTLARLGPDEVARRFTAFDARVYDDFGESVGALQAGVAAGPITPENVPEELRRKFVGRDGRYLLEIYPRVNTWERAGARRFVDELRSVTPDVTGTPIITHEAIALMESAYREGTLYAFVCVGALTALVLRRPRAILLGLVPFVLGTLWAVGSMPALGLRFNLSNVWGLPLMIGASAEYGINLVMRFVESRAHGGPAFPRSTGAAVFLSGLTTVVGFGSLLVADHRGIWSLGLLLTLGSCTGLAAALVVLPALLRQFGR